MTIERFYWDKFILSKAIRIFRITKWHLLVLLTVLSACSGFENHNEYLLNNHIDWAIYRGDQSGIQWSALKQINTNNVGQLSVAWEYHHGNPGPPSMYSNPIVIDGLLYFTSPTLDVICLNAKTGKQIWKFVVADLNNGKVISGRNRGVTYWKGDNGEERIFAFVKNRIYAIQAKTGKHIKEFGENGYIDLNRNLDMDSGEADVEMTSPGIIYQNHLIVGGRVSEGYNSTPGDIRSYHAATGDFEWIFHTVPRKGEPGFETWEFLDGETYGGANPWGGFTVDEKRGWVFCATGSPAPDFIYGGTRKGTNLYGNCILSLDAETGKKVWHYQTIHHDIFDYDNPPAPILATTTINGNQKDIVVQFTKMGLTFVLDRETGEPLFETPEVSVPQSVTEGEESWPNQPIPIKPPPLTRYHIKEQDITDVSVESNQFVLNQFKQYDSGPLFTPANEKGVITMPGHQGGVEWGGGAFNPNSNIVFVNVNHAPTINRLVRFYDIDEEQSTPILRGANLYFRNCTACHGTDRQGISATIPSLKEYKQTKDQIVEILQYGKGLMPAFQQLDSGEIDDLIAFLKSDTETSGERFEPELIKYSSNAPFLRDQDGYPGIKPPWGTLNAIDLAEGELVWEVPFGEYPDLVKSGITGTGSMSYGGPIATAGGLIFIAATPDEKIRAFNQQDGTVLWEYKLPAAGYATPATYQIEGKQYFVIVCGGGGKLGTSLGDSVLAFSLDQ